MSRNFCLEPHTIAIVVFDRLSVFHLAVPSLVFGEDRTDVGVPAFKLKLCAAEAGVLRTSIGMSIEAPFGLAGLRGAGTVIVPSWRDTDERPPKALLKALQRAHAAGARIVGLCLGAFVLAEAGLLDGRPATTHWGMSARFAQRFPSVRMQSDVLYVDEGDVVTSAGTAAGLDCCLHLLRRDFGADIANRVARRIVLAPHRQGGQAQYVEQTVPASGANHRLSALLEWLSCHLDQAHDLDALAARAAMGRRTFTRHFRQITGVTVGQWLLNHRLADAQRMLETTDQSIESVALITGLGSAMSLRQHFSAAFSVSPSTYRRQFRQR